jgi:uncharacterized protein YjbI with pentapeptide repeats
MNENNNNQKDQHSEEQQPSDETEPKLREISKEELKQILEEHKKWVETKGKEGKKADLKNADLQMAFLKEANLKKASLEGINLQKADINRANLKRACLDSAKLKKANLYKTKLQNSNLDGVNGLNEAHLNYANFEGATGLLGSEFAQADVTGTKLPDGIKDFKALEIVKETSQNARKVFFAMLLGCVYSWLTIATTTDVRLLTNTASSPLPIIGTEIPIAWFYIAAPLVLMCLYFYLHLYLDNLWEGLASLPAIFPDGKRLDQRAYPWLLNTLVRKHFKRLEKRSFIARMKEWITIFLAWWVVPITMIAFWLRYIPRHDWIGTIFHIGLIVVSFAFAIIFYRLCALTLQGKVKEHFRLQYFYGDRRFYNGVRIVMVGILFSIVSYGAIEGVSHYDVKKGNLLKIVEFVPWAFEKIGYDVFADFREKAVSEKPDRYWEIPEVDLFKYVNGANLKGRNLNNANMYKAFLVKADLRSALLINANLSYANLEIANLERANLTNANLQQANIWIANLKNANLEGANLTGIQFPVIDRISNVKTLYKAKLDDSLIERINECCPQLLEKPQEETK